MAATFFSFRKNSFTGTVAGIILFFFALVAIAAVQTIAITIVNELKNQVDELSLSGTGSMYPTFPKGIAKTPKEQARETVATPKVYRYPDGIYFLNRLFLHRPIVRGDIVVFKNKVTEEITLKQYDRSASLVKRVIGLPGETVEIKNGFVLINSKPIDEPYIAQARSTYGGDFLPDCKPLQIPENKLFVMGDNRKGSGDSRHDVGFVDISDVHHFIPLQKQKGALDKSWRDTTKDLTNESKIKLDKQKYLGLLNEERIKTKARPLKYNPRLEKSAQARGVNMLQFDDFSYEATRSGLTYSKAITAQGFYHHATGESHPRGYYSAEELIENQLEFPESKKFFLDPNYESVGIAEVEGFANSCPTQVIVLHFAGYVPPNYKQEVIDSWKNALLDLKRIQPLLDSFKQGPRYEKNKSDLDRYADIVNLRISRIEQIIARMEKNEWLTATEEKYVSEDESLGNEQSAIVDRVNRNP